MVEIFCCFFHFETIKDTDWKSFIPAYWPDSEKKNAGTAGSNRIPKWRKKKEPVYVAEKVPEFNVSVKLLASGKEGHTDQIRWCEFHPTKNLIVSGSNDNSVCVWALVERM